LRAFLIGKFTTRISIDEFILSDEHLFKHAFVHQILRFDILALSFGNCTEQVSR
jgi:hypothetical protein